jgi:hypothetical protein
MKCIILDGSEWNIASDNPANQDLAENGEIKGNSKKCIVEYLPYTLFFCCHVWEWTIMTNAVDIA